MHDIAIIGLRACLPGAKDIDQFWKLLSNGEEGIVDLPDVHHLSQKNWVNRSGYIDDIECFDAEFFGYSPQEAALIDPQQRILLQEVYSALESAGYCQSGAMSIGLFASSSFNTYLINNILCASQVNLANQQTLLGNSQDCLATRIAYKLNLTSPAMTIQCGCSSSLVALHQAVTALSTFQCDLAVVGAVSISIPTKQGYHYVSGGVVSEDGHCRPFDANATGTIFTSGVAVVVLQRRDDAHCHGSQIYAVIKGSAVNNDGSGKVGYTAPSVLGQAEVIEQAQRHANISPQSISYVEAHGTATRLGDPVEVAALNKAFRNRGATKNGYCGLGSVKSNIGHLDVAAGLVGLVKVCLMLKHQILVPTLHFQRWNSQIEDKDQLFYVTTELQEWKPIAGERLTGVSSFGVGGTNAHVIVGEDRQKSIETSQQSYNLLFVSAKTDLALNQIQAQLETYIRENPKQSLSDIAWTLYVGREKFNYRAAYLWVDQSVRVYTRPTAVSSEGLNSHSVVFVYNGQGSQYFNMTGDLYYHFSYYRDVVDECIAYANQFLDEDFHCVLFAQNQTGIDITDNQFTNPIYSQLSLFIISFALTKLLEKYQVKPDIVMGHSFGEYVACCIAGVFTWQEAIRLVIRRGKLLQCAIPGKMLSVVLTHEQAKMYETDEIVIAAYNASNIVVFSGTVSAINHLAVQLKKNKIICQFLSVEVPFHSPLLSDLEERFFSMFDDINLKQPCMPIVSNINGQFIVNDTVSHPSYWFDHMLKPVRFDKSIHTIDEKLDSTYFVEIGGSTTLKGLINRILDKTRCLVVDFVRRSNEKMDDREKFFKGLAQLWLGGVQVDLTEMFKNQKRKRVNLPTYPFSRDKYWLESDHLRQAGSEQPVDDDNHLSPVTSREPMEKWLYSNEWRRIQLLNLDNHYDNIWLIFCFDRKQKSCQITDALKQKCQNSLLIYYSDKLSINENSIGVNFYHEMDYQKLFNYIRSVLNFEKISVLFYMNDSIEFSNLSQIDIHLLNPFIFLVNTLVKSELKLEKLSLLTVEAEKVYTSDNRRPYHAAIKAIFRSFMQEYASINCQHIDIDHQTLLSEDASRKVVTIICSKVHYFTLAIRDAWCWIPDFSPIRLDQSIRQVAENQNGFYLVVGGLGNVGFVHVKFLLTRTQANVLIIGRKQLLITESSDEKCNFLKSYKDRVRYQSCDVNHFERLSKFVAESANHSPCLGIIYAAGISSDYHFRSLQGIDANYIESVFRPKVNGLLNIKRLTDQVSIPFCMVISSISSFLSGISLAIYGAVHAFVDEWVMGIAKTSATHWLLVNWEAWSFHQKNSSANTIGGLGKALNQLSVAEDEGLLLLEKIFLLKEQTQLIVSTCNMNRRYQRWVNTGMGTTADKDRAHYKPRPVLKTDFVMAAGEQELSMISIWEKLLGIRGIGIQDNFFELGGDSLLLLQLVSDINVKFNSDLSAVTVFENPTVKNLINYLNFSTQNDEDGQHLINDKERALKRRMRVQQSRKRIRVE